MTDEQRKTLSTLISAFAAASEELGGLNGSMYWNSVSAKQDRAETALREFVTSLGVPQVKHVVADGYIFDIDTPAGIQTKFAPYNPGPVFGDAVKYTNLRPVLFPFDGVVAVDKVQCTYCSETGSYQGEGCTDCNGKGFNWEPV